MSRASMFQFTHPVWGATSISKGVINETTVSIHAPRVGCDSIARQPSSRETFQFTHPVWGATISCHSL